MRFLDGLFRGRRAVPPAPGRPDRAAAMGHAFEFAAKNGLDGVYLEFGCFEGASFINAWRAYGYWLEQAARHGWPMTRRPMYAFDSFEGLPQLAPEDRQPGYGIFAAGQYRCSRERFDDNLRSAGVDPAEVRVVPGFYDRSLGPEVRDAILPARAMVVHLDCDLYSSAADALAFLPDLVTDGTLVLLDDYFCHRGNPRFGVRRALDEWAERESVVLTPYMHYSWAGLAVIVSPVSG